MFIYENDEDIRLGLSYLLKDLLDFIKQEIDDTRKNKEDLDSEQYNTYITKLKTIFRRIEALIDRTKNISGVKHLAHDVLGPYHNNKFFRNLEIFK